MSLLNMNKQNYLHAFIIGAIIPFVLSGYILVPIILTMLLLLLFGDFIVPIIFALFADLAFAPSTSISHFLGLKYTFVTIILIVVMLKVRKLLKI